MTTSTKRAYSTPTVLELGDLRALTAHPNKSGSPMHKHDECDGPNRDRSEPMYETANGGVTNLENGGDYEECDFETPFE